VGEHRIGWADALQKIILPLAAPRTVRPFPASAPGITRRTPIGISVTARHRFKAGMRHGAAPGPTALLLCLLAGCAVGGAGTAESVQAAQDISAPIAVRAQQSYGRGQYQEAAEEYYQAASQAPTQPQMDEYHLRAAEAATENKDYGFAERILQTVPEAALNPEQRLRMHIVRARGAFVRNDPQTMLALLAGDPGSGPHAQIAMLWRARAQFLAGDPVGATQTLVQRESLLSDPRSIGWNRDTIWSGLKSAMLDSATLAKASDADPLTRGWVELANLARSRASVDLYEGWRRRYPNHPGESRLASLDPAFAPAAAATPAAAPAMAQVPSSRPAAAPPAADANPPFVSPSVAVPVVVPPGSPAPAPMFSTVPARSGFFALLFPQNGAFSAVADSVRAGIGAAVARTGTGVDIRMYAVGNEPGAASAAYRQAVAEGAGVAIGPILKDHVIELSQNGGLPVPVVALNYLDGGRSAPAGFYQFGLAPEDEARAAAEDAYSRGLRRAIALVQDNERGSRVLAAFSARLEELGGETVDSARYSGEPQSWAAPVRDLMHFRPVDDKKKLAELRAKAKPGTDPQRRNDFDFIFIDPHDADQARVLWPFFRFYHAEREPIYATSTVDDGASDMDLAGIRFCDSPWLLDRSSPAAAALRSEALNGRSPNLARLYVLGGDAFQLALRLSQNKLHPLDDLPGDTGSLEVGDDGAVHRGLMCAQTTEGDPKLLDAPAPTPPQ
jgi:outer membrane PBP1 activator LpoA protein